MGCGLTLPRCATSQTHRTQGAAGAAPLFYFAPLRHLRHPLIGEGEVPQWRSTTATTRAQPHHPAAQGRTSPTARQPYARLLTGIRCIEDHQQHRQDSPTACEGKGGIDLNAIDTAITSRLTSSLGQFASNACDYSVCVRLAASNDVIIVIAPHRPAPTSCPHARYNERKGQHLQGCSASGPVIECHGKGFRARSLMNFNTLGSRRARATYGCRCCRPDIPHDLKTNLKIEGVAGKSQALADKYLNRLFRGPFLEILCHQQFHR
jgi:hypothetical protein